ncbi:ead/Ea22-like family protein [Phreatobacter sp. HK31-P]
MKDDTLRKLAQAATRGPWTHYRNKLRPWMKGGKINEVQCGERTPVVAWSGFDDSNRPEAQHARNAKFIAAANPETIIALLDRIEAAEAALRAKESTMPDEIEKVARPAPQAARGEIAKLRAMLKTTETARDEAMADLRRATDPTLQHMHLENGRLDMAVAGPVVERMSLVFVEWFRETGARNNIEMSFSAKSEPFERYIVTVQKVLAKTPAEQRKEAEKRAEAAEAALARLTAPSPRYGHKKRGTTYAVVGMARVQTARPLKDMEPVTVYRCEQTGDLWARPSEEFYDGRFEPIYDLRQEPPPCS